MFFIDYGWYNASLPSSVMRGTLDPQAEPLLDDLDGLLTCINPGGRKSEMNDAFCQLFYFLPKHNTVNLLFVAFIYLFFFFGI